MMTHTRLVELLIQATKDGDIEWGLVTSDMKPLTITGAELLQHFEARIMGVYVTLFPRVAEYPIGSGNRKLALALVAMGVPGNGRLTTNNALIPGVETPARMAMLILYLSVSSTLFCLHLFL